MKNQNLDFSDETVKKYLYYFRTENKIYDAGRGWYSTIKEPFRLDTTPVEGIGNSIKKQFPLLPFSVWSTEQIKSYFHHLPAKFITFIYSDKDFLRSIFNNLKEGDYEAYLNPSQLEIGKTFGIKNDTYILRPSITKEPKKGNFATIEKILIDLLIENEKLALMDNWEYQNLFKNIVFGQRISIGSLWSYAERRKVLKQIEKSVKKA